MRRQLNLLGQFQTSMKNLKDMKQTLRLTHFAANYALGTLVTKINKVLQKNLRLHWPKIKVS
jgi:hypothetical protein